MTARLSAWVIFLAVLAMPGLACHRTKVQSGLTGVNLTVHYDKALRLTALKMAGWIGSTPAFKPGLLPVSPRPLTSGAESAAILVAENLGGKMLILRVDGQAGDVLAASGQVAVVLKSAALVTADVTLGAPAICGDSMIRAGVEQCDDGNTTAGDGCSPDCLTEGQGACGPANCPVGCCQDGICEPRALATCGTGGAACMVCLATRADSCSEAGGCGCGSGPPCTEGQVCLNGACACDATSCPDGCCRGGACVAPARATCGVGGARCTACDPSRADRCDGKGACACGNGAECAAGQRCAGGQCVCDGTSCPSGCCEGATCATRSLSTCGTAGSTCAACDTRADSCSSAGECRCGVGPTCAPGQRCLGGTCVCDGTSCPDGCCAGGMCLDGDSASSCGTGGNRCDACPAGQACANGRCSGCSSASCPDGCCSGATCNRPPSLASCGSGGDLCVGCDAHRADGCSVSGACTCGGKGQCAVGTRCLNGACVCRPASCPSGCCLGNVCSSPTVSSCGSAGGTCTACNEVLSDKCTAAGSCGCGAGPACAANQHCVSGSCICDATSCPNGCCEGNVCQAQGPTTCGPGGGACRACGTRADRCSSAGVCRCGDGPACADGARCQNGNCVCDGTSCPGGCCSGATCVVGTDPTACGTGGAACQNCQGGTCMSGVCSACTAASCAGCCSGSTCTLTGSVQACGAGGAACVACDPSRADGCSAAGVCTCGGQPACGAGKSCVLGVCFCDARSCPAGCCAAGTCQTLGVDACGAPGAACSVCPPQMADSCDGATGSCRCGSKPACVAGTVCQSGSCVCNQASCPSGCCANGVCMSPPSPMACGTEGGTCIPCDVTTADTCDAPTGTCRCGNAPACDEGTHCASGTCVANP